MKADAYIAKARDSLAKAEGQDNVHARRMWLAIARAGLHGALARSRPTIELARLEIDILLAEVRWGAR